MTLEDIIEVASRKYPRLKDVHTGRSDDALAAWLLQAIKDAYKDNGKDFDQLTRCADSIHKRANLVYDIWSHMLEVAESAQGKPATYDKIGA